MLTTCGTRPIATGQASLEVCSTPFADFMNSEAECNTCVALSTRHFLPSVISSVTDLLPRLCSDAQSGRAHIQSFLSANYINLCAYEVFPSTVPAEIGEYGYIKRGEGGREDFVRLGHIDELMSEPSTPVEASYRTLTRGISNPWRHLPGWPEHVFRCV